MNLLNIVVAISAIGMISLINFVITIKHRRKMRNEFYSRCLKIINYTTKHRVFDEILFFNATYLEIDKAYKMKSKGNELYLYRFAPYRMEIAMEPVYKHNHDTTFIGYSLASCVLYKKSKRIAWIDIGTKLVHSIYEREI